MLQNVEQAFKTHSSGWNLNILIHLVKKNKKLVTNKCKKNGRKNILDYFAKDIPKDIEFLKRWSHNNFQTTYVE